MRTANILTGIAVVLWIGFAIEGRKGIGGVVGQHVLGYPNTGQIDGYVFWPCLVVIVLLACAWACNGWRRWYVLQSIVAGLALLVLVPYLAMSGGGI